MSAFQARSLKRKNVKGLALNAAATARPPLNRCDSNSTGQTKDGTDSAADDITGGYNGMTSGELEIGLEFKLDLRSEDLVVLKDLGAGNGGSVSKVMHASTKVVMARKVIRVDAKENVRKQIVRELQVGHDCKSPYIVTFYGAFQNEARDIVLCMEYMDCGSLDSISKEFGPIRVDVLGKITESILGGLVYLYEVHRIMHRDIKPSNVLVNSRGNIKLCDFGVAGETVNSIADTFVGTSTYMAPERIQGGRYTVRSDVWSVGLTIMELAVGRFPFDYSDNVPAEDRNSGSSENSNGSNDDSKKQNAGPMGILDLLQQIVHEPAPKLPKSDAFPKILEDFVAKCLLKKPEERPTPRELYDLDPFLKAAKRTPVDLRGWAIEMMNKKNRKSYLNPPAPRSIQNLGRQGVNTAAGPPAASANWRQHERARPSQSQGVKGSVSSVSSTSSVSSGMAGGARQAQAHVVQMPGTTGRATQTNVRSYNSGDGSGAGGERRQQPYQSQPQPQQTRSTTPPPPPLPRRLSPQKSSNDGGGRPTHIRAQPSNSSVSRANMLGLEPIDVSLGNLSIDDQQRTPLGSPGVTEYSGTPSAHSTPLSLDEQQSHRATRSRSSSLRQAIANVGANTNFARPLAPRRQHSSTAVGSGPSANTGYSHHYGHGLARTLLDYHDGPYPPGLTTPTHVFTTSPVASGFDGRIADDNSNNNARPSYSTAPPPSTTEPPLNQSNNNTPNQTTPLSTTSSSTAPYMRFPQQQPSSFAASRAGSRPNRPIPAPLNGSTGWMPTNQGFNGDAF